MGCWLFVMCCRCQQFPRWSPCAVVMSSTSSWASKMKTSWILLCRSWLDSEAVNHCPCSPAHLLLEIPLHSITDTDKLHPGTSSLLHLSCSPVSLCCLEGLWQCVVFYRGKNVVKCSRTSCSCCTLLRRRTEGSMVQLTQILIRSTWGCFLSLRSFTPEYLLMWKCVMITACVFPFGFLSSFFWIWLWILHRMHGIDDGFV